MLQALLIFSAVSILSGNFATYLKKHPTFNSKIKWFKILVFIGIAGSGGYDVERQVSMTPGQQEQVGGYNLVYESLGASMFRVGPHHASLRVLLNKDACRI